MPSIPGEVAGSGSSRAMKMQQAGLGAANTKSRPKTVSLINAASAKRVLPVLSVHVWLLLSLSFSLLLTNKLTLY